MTHVAGGQFSLSFTQHLMRSKLASCKVLILVFLVRSDILMFLKVNVTKEKSVGNWGLTRDLTGLRVAAVTYFTIRLHIGFYSYDALLKACVVRAGGGCDS